MGEEKKYDATYRDGNTIIHIVAPKITEEERKRRLEEAQRIIWLLWAKYRQKP
jgi:hypothetical protein